MTAVALDPVTLEVIKNGLASVADEMALVIMRSAYSPVVRDTMDYSTALCDRDGELVAQGLTLAVQLGTFPTVMRHLREQFGGDVHPGDVFISNDPYGFGGQHLPDIYVIQPIFHAGELEGYAATMAHHVDVGGITPGLDRRALDRDLPGGPAASPAQAVRGGPREHDHLPHHREEHAAADRGDRRPARADRCVPGGRARADGDPRAVRRGRDAPLPRRAAGAERAPDARRARRAARRHLDVRGLHRRRRRGAGASGDHGRADGARRRGLGGLRGHRAAGTGGAQLPGRHGQRRRLLRVPGYRRPRDPEHRRLHAADPHQRAGGDDREPGAPRGVRCARRHRLPRHGHGDGRTRAGRAGQGDRAGRGRADAHRDRRLRGRQAVRPHRGDRRLLGRAGGTRRPRGGLEPARQPLEPARRAGGERAAAAGARLRARPRLGRAGALPRRPRVRALVRAARRRGGADRALRSPRAPALRHRRRRGGSALRQHDRRSSRADDADGGVEAAPRRRFPPRLRGRRRQRLAAGARPGPRSGGRPRRQGLASRRHGSATGWSSSMGAWTRPRPPPPARELRRPHPRRHRLRRHRRARPRRRRRRQGRPHRGDRRAGRRRRSNRRERARGHAGLHRHPHPLRLHAADGSACGQRDSPGRDNRGRRQLRLRLLPDP